MGLKKDIHDEGRAPSSGRQTLASFMHIMTVATISIFLVFLMVSCIAGIGDAMQSVEKYEIESAKDAEKLANGGAFLYWLYYVHTGALLKVLLLFGLVLLEFILYISCYRRAKAGRPMAGSFWFLGAVLAIHTAIFVHSQLIPEPSRLLDDWLLLEETLLLYRTLASITIGPSILFFFSYLCCFRVHRPTNRSTGDGSMC